MMLYRLPIISLNSLGDNTYLCAFALITLAISFFHTVPEACYNCIKTVIKEDPSQPLDLLTHSNV